MPFRSGIYIVPTHRWYIERTVWLIAGLVLLVVTALAALLDPRWVLAIIGVGLVSINVALTGFCPVGNGLRLLGFTPMLATRAPTRWNLYFMQTVWWLLFTGFVGVAMGVVRRDRVLHHGEQPVLARGRAAARAGTKADAGLRCHQRPARTRLSL